MLTDCSLSAALLFPVSSCDIPLSSNPAFGPPKIPTLRTCFWGELQPRAGIGTVLVSLAAPALLEAQPACPAAPRDDMEDNSSVSDSTRQLINENWPFNAGGLAFGG